MAGRRRCLTLTSSFPHLVHVLLPHVSFLPPVFLHLLPFSLWTFPTLLTPHLALLRHIFGHLHMRVAQFKLWWGRRGSERMENWKEKPAIRLRVGSLTTPPQILYIYIVYFSNVVVWGLFSFHAKKNQKQKNTRTLQLVSLCKIVNTPKLNEWW